MQLTFDFPGAVRRVYRDPLRVITVHEVSGILPALRQIEAAIADGLHAAGYLSYEAAPAFDSAYRVRVGNRLPLLCFGLFGDYEIRDPVSAQASLDDATASNWTMDTSRTEFDRAIQTIRAAIAEGRTYQVNYSTRFRSRLQDGSDGSIAGLYEQLRAAQGHGYHALLDFDRHRILSASPELFFERRGSQIITRPMKGTRKRGRWQEEDEALADELAGSEKDRAENLMIVDLLRNDLGRVARTGSVRVERLYTIERYRTVHQLTSTISGEVAGNTSVTDILRALFPCGSVTGAPKISTMQIIAELEPTPREVYCGAIGWIDPGGDCTFSVPIRTLWIDVESGESAYGSGAGITYDSLASIEYDEVVAKAAVLDERWPDFELFETMRVENGVICRRARHLRRLTDSARYFGYPCDPSAIDAALEDAVAKTGSGVHRLRVYLSADGRVRTHCEPFEALAGVHVVGFADATIDSRNRFLYHKTTNRGIYDAAMASRSGVFDVLLRNERGEVTEFTRGNIVVDVNGQLVTPTRSCGLLAGTLREELLETGTIVEGVLTVADVRAASRVWLINSLRGWVPVSITDVRTAPDPIPG